MVFLVCRGRASEKWTKERRLQLRLEADRRARSPWKLGHFVRYQQHVKNIAVRSHEKNDNSDNRGENHEKQNHNSSLLLTIPKKNVRSRFTYRSSCFNPVKETSGRTSSHSVAQAATPSIQEHIHN